jgi:predicted protein tyrosine phosphatase
VRSAGTGASARHRVTGSDLRWADVVLAMEAKHKARLLADHADAVAGRPIHVLDIPDVYGFMDPELVELLRSSVEGILGLEASSDGAGPP